MVTLDPGTLRIVSFIKNHFVESGSKGLVLGLSGGIDSTVVAFLSVRAVGSDKVTGVFLFEDGAKNSVDYQDAKRVASMLGINTIELSISPLVRSVLRSLGSFCSKPSRVTVANIKARSRMILLYAIANQSDLLVIGTGDRSEIELGYFTKFGDGGVDLLPIGHLYKTDVRKLAKRLGVPPRILVKPSSPRLWKSHKATDELPADYPILDKILASVYDRKVEPSLVSKKLKVRRELIDKVKLMHDKSEHKRHMPLRLRPVS
jgi:NAD+ synthase